MSINGLFFVCLFLPAHYLKNLSILVCINCTPLPYLPLMLHSFVFLFFFVFPPSKYPQYESFLSSLNYPVPPSFNFYSSFLRTVWYLSLSITTTSSHKHQNKLIRIQTIPLPSTFLPLSIHSWHNHWNLAVHAIICTKAYRSPIPLSHQPPHQ